MLIYLASVLRRLNHFRRVIYADKNLEKYFKISTVHDCRAFAFNFAVSDDDRRFMEAERCCRGDHASGNRRIRLFAMPND